MSRTPPAMLLYVGDYLRDTLHLTTLEHGAYLLLLLHAWTHDATVPKEPETLRQITKLSSKQWYRSKNKLLALFVPAGDVLESKRSRAERAKLLKTNETTPPLSNLNLNKSLIDRVTLKTESVGTPPAPQKSAPKKLAYPEAFDRFWLAYPRTQTMSKKETLDAWKRLSEEDRRLAATSLPAFKAYCIKHPDYPVIHACRYLSKRRFDSFATSQPRHNGPPPNLEGKALADWFHTQQEHKHAD